MDQTDQAKSTEKPNSHSSDGKNRRRPSLFPIRNSAKRRGSFSQNNHLFDPHLHEKGQINYVQQTSTTSTPGNNSDKGQPQFQYKTPSQHSNFSSPRTPRSTPKQFDTPFVPFVHQSLSRTIWQSQETIPQERYQCEKKQSQTQPNNHQCQEVSDHESKSIKQGENSARLQNIYPNLNQYEKISPSEHLKKQQDQNQSKEGSQFLQNQICTSITILPSGKNQVLEQNTIYNQNSQVIIKQETKNDNNDQVSEILHQVFISKAHIYCQEEKKKINKFLSLSKGNFYSQSVQPQKRRPILTYSYLQCISVRPSFRQVSQYGQQIQVKKLNKSHIKNIQISPIDKNCILCQTQKNNMQACNKTHSHVQSVKKSNYTSQTSFSDRLKIISQNYQQKIGKTKQYINRGEQIHIQTRNCALQTDEEEKKSKKQFSISQQINVSMNYDYGNVLGEKIDQFEKYIKSYCQSRQSQIENLRSRKFIDQEMNTQNQHINVGASSIKKSKGNKKSMKDFGSQYDIKDAGNRSSLKRVSIADTKIIFIQDSNSTQTFDKSHEKQQTKQNKSKPREKVIEVKMQQEQSQQNDQSQLYAPPVVQETRKSKRKASKTPAKKKNKK